MIMYRTAVGVHGKRKVGNPWFITTLAQWRRQPKILGGQNRLTLKVMDGQGQRCNQPQKQ